MTVMADILPTLATCIEMRQKLKGAASSACPARGLVARTLEGRGLPAAVPAGELVVTELVANAVKHTRCPVIVVKVTRLAQDRTRIAVFDPSEERPVPGKPAPEQEGGRGLTIIAAMAADWGVETRATGKWVWAELDAKGSW
ncbi:ATP-binding protein [Streptomyces sp. NPDC059785]|uniref:ATP-binding protein n=1 Tax=Streptomyces sp. NPDC059785 TaxID=3346945 RepID=UPI00365E596C